MQGEYRRPSELLNLQKQTGKSYWDLIGRPLYDNRNDSAVNDPVLKLALLMQIDEALRDYDGLPQYKGGKSEKSKFQHSVRIRPNSVNKFLDQYLAAGIDPYHLAGIAGNAAQESLFEEGAIDKALGGKFWGQLQMSQAMRDEIRRVYGSLSAENANRFVIDALKGDKKISNDWLRYMKQNGGFMNRMFNNASDAAMSFGRVFERPKEELADWNQRKRSAEDALPYILDRYKKMYGKDYQHPIPMKRTPLPIEVERPNLQIPNQVVYEYPQIEYVDPATTKTTYYNPITDSTYDDYMLRKDFAKENYDRMIRNVKSNTPDILQLYHQYNGWNRGKSFTFNFWNKNGNSLSPVNKYT